MIALIFQRRIGVRTQKLCYEGIGFVMEGGFGASVRA